MGRQIEELAAFVATTRWEDIPEPVRHHAKLTLLDTLGVILAGSERPEIAQLRERLAAAGAKLTGLDAAGISRAMRIATVLVLTPSYTNAVAGATALNIAGGMSGHAAALAPELALAGFEAQEDAVEEALGKLVGGGFDSAPVAENLGGSWHITHNYFRLYACCNPIHPALDCLAAVLAELRPRADEVERIDIATYRFASVMRNPDPPNYFASKYSLPHAAAAMVVR